MRRAIYEKPLAELSWSDFESVVFNRLEEDQTLEFKETLPARDGNADIWQLGQDKIGSYARDTLAKQVVAFANAYGGVIIIGIAENDERPPRANNFGDPLIRNCIDCVERLGPSLRSLIDPPIAGFDIRAFPTPGGSGEGLVIIRVVGSTQAPHGVGRPPEAYVRRGSVKEPLTMRDLQNLFWEARTRQERVLQVRAERRQFLIELEQKKQAGRLIRSSDRQPVPASVPHLMFRCTVIPEEPLGLRGIAAELITNPLARPVIQTKGNPAIPAFGDGVLPCGWLPKAHAAQAEDFSHRMFSLWTIGEDGLAEVIGFSLRQEAENKHYPGWFSLAVAQVLLMAEKLRLRAGRPDVPLAIDAQFQHDGTALAMLDRESALYSSPGVPDEKVKIGPFLVATRAEIPRVHQEVEREIWFGLGVSRIIPANIDFDRAFSEYLGVNAG